jgi:hypothetical protein
MAVTGRVDYQGLLTNQLQSELTDVIVRPSLDKLYSLFTKNTDIREGSLITDPNCIGETLNGGAFTRSDVDPASMTVTWGKPYWTKVYYHESAKIRKEDIDEANGNLVTIQNLFVDAAKRATTGLLNTHVFGGICTQIKADVDSSAVYGNTTRVTAWQSYEENTDTAITIAILRAMFKALYLKGNVNSADYITLFEPNVWSVAWPLMDALVSRTRLNPSVGDSNAAGYQEVPALDLFPVMDLYGMTTGDVFCLNRSDVQIQNHKALELTQKTPENLKEYAYEVVARIGVNCWVRHPARQGKLTLKD